MYNLKIDILGLTHVSGSPWEFAKKQEREKFNDNCVKFLMKGSKAVASYQTNDWIDLINLELLFVSRLYYMYKFSSKLQLDWKQWLCLHVNTQSRTIKVEMAGT